MDPETVMAKQRGRRAAPLFDSPTSETSGDQSAAEAREPSVELIDAAESRYLNYALSVITSRALPDVRDGLKPVQRRILYTMWQRCVTFAAKHRKCANVVERFCSLGPCPCREF